MLETLVFQGGAVKALGSGKVGGHLVLYGSEAERDLGRDFFTAKTDYDVDTFPAKSSVYYHHGLDPQLKTRKLANGEMKATDAGIWVETQLALRDDYERAVYKMAEEGKLGWSSGTASHLVERKAVGDAFEIIRWPLGLDASLTPTPCDTRNIALPIKAMSLKAWADMQDTPSAKGLFDADDLAQSLTISAVARLQDALWYEIYDALYYDESFDIEALAGTFDQFQDFALRAIAALMGLAGTEAKSALVRADVLRDIKALARPRAGEIKTERDFEKLLRDAGFSRSQSVAITTHGYKSTTVQRDADDGLSDVLSSLKGLTAAFTS